MAGFIGTFNISIKGTSHLEMGVECQDFSRVETLDNGWVIAAIADGLGSAVHSEIGSHIAVDTVIETFLASKFTIWDEKELHNIFLSAFHKALESIYAKAHSDGNSETEYDTTLTSVIYDGNQAFFLHVGDGGIIILTKNGEFSVVTTAQKGDAFNEVVPLRAGEERWQFGVSKTDVCSILMMTDGIFDIACPPIYAHTSQPILINYVRQFMDISFMRSRGHKLGTIDDFRILQSKLERFYSGAGTSGITDDKTILGIINTSPEYQPNEREPEYYKELDISAIIEEQNKRLYENKEREAEVEKNRHDIIERDRKSHTIIKTKLLPPQESPVNTLVNCITSPLKKGEKIRIKRMNKKRDKILLKRKLKMTKIIIK